MTISISNRSRKARALLTAITLALWSIACTVSPTPTPTPIATATLMVGKLVDREQANLGDVLQYTLVIMNDQLRGDDPGTSVQLVDRLPDALELVAGSLSADATYDADTRTVRWSGQVQRGLSVDVTFQARLTAVAVGMQTVVNTVAVTDAFDREREASAQTAVLGPSGTVTPTEPAQPSVRLTTTPGGTQLACLDVAPFAPGCLDQARPAELEPDVEFVGILPVASVTAAAWSPDGTRLAYSVNDPDGWSGVEVRQAPQYGLLARWEAAGASELTWSLDGQAVLFVFDRGDTSSIGLARVGQASWQDLLPGEEALLAVGASKHFAGWLHEGKVTFVVPCGTGCGSLLALDITNGGLSQLLEAGRLPGTTEFVGTEYLLHPGLSLVAAASWGTGLPRTAVLAWTDSALPVDLSALLGGRYTEAQSWAGDLLAFVAYPPGEPNDWSLPPQPELYVWDTNAREFRKVASGAKSAQFSPAGDRLAVLFVGEPQPGLAEWVQSEGSVPHVGLLSWPEGRLLAAVPVGTKGLGEVVELWRLPALTWASSGEVLASQLVEGGMLLMSKEGHTRPLIGALMVRWIGWGGGQLALLVGEELWLVRAWPQLPGGAMRTYVDGIWGIAFDHPASWEVDGFQGAAALLLAPDTADAGRTVLAVSLIGTFDTLDLTLAEVRRSAWGPHMRHVEAVQLGQFDALRVELEPGEERPVQVWLVVTPAGQAVGFIPMSDLTVTQAVMGTLRAVGR